MKTKVTVFLIVFTAAVMTSGALGATYNFEDNWGQAGINLVSQDPSGVEIVFSVPQVDVMEVAIDGEMMHSIIISGVILPNTAGAPDLPGISRFIAIPQGATADLEIIAVRRQVIPDVNVIPAFEIPADTDDSPLKYEKNPDIYSTNAFYPEQPVMLYAPDKIRGVDVVRLGVTPFQYNPVTRELVMYKDIRVRVRFQGGNGHFGEDRLRSRWWEPILGHHLLNYASLPQIDFNRVSQTDEDNVEYLIIVPDDPDFLAWADTIKQWRNEQGIITGITTITEIGGNDVDLIENYIDNAYDTWDPPPAAVLLMSDYQGTGDTYGITTRVHYYYSNQCVSDNYYADTGYDHLPDIAMARLPVQDADDLQNAIGKMLEYERYPSMQKAFYAKPVTAGGWQTERWFILCDEVIWGYFHHVRNKMPTREYAIYQGTPGAYWSSNPNTWMVVNYFGPNGLQYIPSTPQHLTDWGANAYRMTNDINRGCFIVQHRDHGYPEGWGEPDYNVGHLSALVNDSYPYILSMNCCTGQYNYAAPSFAEVFIRMEYGAIGVVAASNTSYSFVNDVFTWGVYDLMWPDFDPGYGVDSVGQGNLRPCFGMASGKYYLNASTWASGGTARIATYYLFHHLGGAFMTLYSEPPQHLSVVHSQCAVAGDTVFTVSADEGALIGLSVDGELIGCGDATGSLLSIPISPMAAGDTMKVTVTKADYYRYTAQVNVVEPGSVPPRPVDDLVITPDGTNVELSWSPVGTDMCGSMIDITRYVVYMSQDNPYFVPASGDSIGVVYPPITTYEEVNALSESMRFYNVIAVVENP